MRIGMTYDLQTDPRDPRQAEFDPPRVLDALEAALASLGHDVVRLGNTESLLASRVRLHDVDLVWNLAEGAAGRCREAHVPMLLELWGVPCVGSGAATLALGLDKLMSKRIAAACGIPTPAWVAVDRASDLDPATLPPFPLIVKPRYEGSGIGIDPAAVVQDECSLRRRLEWAIDRFRQPALIESFIPFGELTVVLIGNNPPTALPAIQRPIDPASRLASHVAGGSSAWLCPVALTPELDDAARGLAIHIFDALGCHDVARVDVRVDEAGRLYFLEINPLPSYDPEGSLGLLAEHLGTTYAAMIERILEAVCKRLNAKQKSGHFYKSRDTSIFLRSSDRKIDMSR